MGPQEIRKYIREYLELIENDSRSVSDNEERLPMLLDQLAFAQNFVNVEFDEAEYPDPPDFDYQKIRAETCRRFPNYGFYNEPECVSDKICQCEFLVGDAIDDIADIARDMFLIDWRWDNTSEQDALWNFKNLAFHWLDHIRCLQWYLVHQKRGR